MAVIYLVGVWEQSVSAVWQVQNDGMASVNFLFIALNDKYCLLELYYSIHLLILKCKL